MNTSRLLVPLALAATLLVAGCSTGDAVDAGAPRSSDPTGASAATASATPSPSAEPSSAPSPAGSTEVENQDSGTGSTAYSDRAFADGTRWEQGAPPRLPYAVGTTLYDGSREVTLPEPVLQVHVTATGYALLTREYRVLLLDRQGQSTALGRIANGGVAVSTDGTTVAFRKGTSVVVLDATSGERVASRPYPEAVVIGAGEGRVLVNQDFRDATSRVVWWDWTTDVTEQVVRGVSPVADVAADRLQVTDEESNRVRTVALSDPGTELYGGDLAREACAVDWSASGYALLGPCAGDGFFSVATRVVGPRGNQVEDLDIPVTDVVWESAGSFLAVSTDERTTQVLRCEAEVLCTGATGAYEVTRFDPQTGDREPLIVLARR